MPFIFLFFSLTSITELIFNKKKLENYFSEVNPQNRLNPMIKILFCYRVFFFLLLFLDSIVQLFNTIATKV